MITGKSIVNNKNAWTTLGILTMKYDDDLSYLFVPNEQIEIEIDKIINEATSVGMGC